MSDLKEESLRSEEVYDGALLHVYRDEVQLSNGKTSVREWIKHPGASAVVPLFADGTTVLINQFRFPPRRTFLEVPAGKLDRDGESPETVAARELEEETGWKTGRLHPLGSFYPCIGYSNERIHFYLAEALTEGTQDLGDGEQVEVVRMPFAEAVAMARAGEIVDMKSAVALLYAADFVAAREKEFDSKGRDGV